MNGERDHRRWRADLAAYMIGALEQDEATTMEAHLRECPRCREEIRWLQPAVDMLPESVEQLDPPPQLRERLMAEVGADAPATSQEVEPSYRRRTDRGLFRFGLRPALAAGAAALLVAAVVGYSLGGGGDESPTTTVAAKGLGGLQATLEHSGDEGTLRMTGLEQAPSAHVYEAWVQRGERVQSLSLFDARSDGTANVAIPDGLEGADAVMVTVEPRGGSGDPSSQPLVDVSLSE